ncbi:hypothetical protein P3S68_014655 [Capsicum galapagoense]
MEPAKSAGKTPTNSPLASNDQILAAIQPCPAFSSTNQKRTTTAHPPKNDGFFGTHFRMGDVEIEDADDEL